MLRNMFLHNLIDRSLSFVNLIAYIVTQIAFVSVKDLRFVILLIVDSARFVGENGWPSGSCCFHGDVRFCFCLRGARHCIGAELYTPNLWNNLWPN